MPPIVPTYDQPQVQRRALGTTQQRGISPDAFTEQARQLQKSAGDVIQFSETMQKLENRKQEERDAAVVMAARSSFEKEVADRTIQAKDRRGLNAWGLSDENEAWYKETRAKYLGSMENEAQKAAMSQVLYSREPTFYAGIKGHEVSEQRRAVNDSAKASISADINSAAAGYNDDATVQQAVTSIKRTVAVQQAVNEGWDAERVKDEQLGHTTTLHRQIIKQKLNDDPVMARAHFDQYKDQIAGVDHAEIEGWLKSGASRVKAQEFADGMSAKGLSEMEQIAEARKRLSGDEERDAIAEITGRFSMERAAIERDQQMAREAAHNIVIEPNQTWRDIPADLWARLDPADKERFQKDGYGDKTDWGTYYGLRQLAAKDPEAFGKMDLTPYFGSLDDARRAEMIKLQTKALEDPNDPDIGRTKMQVMQQSAANAGLDPKKDKEDNEAGEKLRQFYRRIDDEILDFAKKNGREPSKKELLEITDRLSIEVAKNRRFWFDLERAAGVAEVEGVPTEMVDDLAAVVEAHGAEVTDENIKALYDHLQRKGQ